MGKCWKVGVFALGVLLSGCAEINQRGGFIAAIEDRILFPAQAKSHRALRSYVITAALVAVAANRGLPAADRDALLGRVFTTLDYAKEAYVCAYESRAGCVFFDEVMSRLDYSIYKLALVVLVDSETTQLVALLQDKLIGEIPVLGKSAKAGLAGVTAVGNAAGAVEDGSKIIDALVRLGLHSLSSGAALLPLYRDAIELDMLIVLDSLSRQCADDLNSVRPFVRRTTDRKAIYKDVVLFGSPSQLCSDFKRGYEIYVEGNGELRAWRRFAFEMSKPETYLDQITPSSDHFAAVSRLILRSLQVMGYPQKDLDFLKHRNIIILQTEVAKLPGETRANEIAKSLKRTDPVPKEPKR